MASSSFSGIGSNGVWQPPPYANKMVARSPTARCRITIFCPDVQSYLENPGTPIWVQKIGRNFKMKEPALKDISVGQKNIWFLRALL